jgi:hypothetical protein
VYAQLNCNRCTKERSFESLHEKEEQINQKAGWFENSRTCMLEDEN